MAQQDSTPEAFWKTVKLTDGRIAIVNAPHYAKFRPQLDARPVRLRGEIAFAFAAKHADEIATIISNVNAKIEQRNADRAAAQMAARQRQIVAEAERIVARVQQSPRPTRRYNTSSGWCEACEDGAINLCRRGGCY